MLRISACCVLQRQSPSLTADLISAFEPLVVDLATNANGNHVIKRFLWCSTRENSAFNIDFILQAACDHCVHIATERHGCCVMQRCCEAATGVLKVSHWKDARLKAKNSRSFPHNRLCGIRLMYACTTSLCRINSLLRLQPTLCCCPKTHSAIMSYSMFCAMITP